MSTAPVTVTWVGHSTNLIDVGGYRVITDPLLTKRVAHLRRRRELPAADTADVDVALLSHVHLDHIHIPSIRKLRPTHRTGRAAQRRAAAAQGRLHRRHRGGRGRPARGRPAPRRGRPRRAQARSRDRTPSSRRRRSASSSTATRAVHTSASACTTRATPTCSTTWRRSTTSTSRCCRSGDGDRPSAPATSIRHGRRRPRS